MELTDSSLLRDSIQQLAHHLSLRDLLSIATANKKFRERLLEKELNDTLAIKLGFPFDLTFVQLKSYESKSLNDRLIIAARIGDMRLVEKLIELGADNFTEAISASIINNRLKVVKFLFVKVSDYSDLENLGVYNAVEFGEFGGNEVLKFLLSKGIFSDDKISILDLAARGGNLELFKFMIEEENTPISDVAFENAIRSGKLSLVEYMVEKGEKDFDAILEKSVGYECIEIMKLAIKLGATNVDDELFKAVMVGVEDKDVLRVLLEHATDEDLIRSGQEYLNQVDLDFDDSSSEDSD